MKLYTGTGDHGTTGLGGGERVSKNHPRVCAYGDLDELMAVLGLVAASMSQSDTDTSFFTGFSVEISEIQARLFTFGSWLASSPRNNPGKSNGLLPQASWATDLENAVDRLLSANPSPGFFVIPGGSVTASYCHVARTVCRRTERSLEHLFETETDSRCAPVALLAVYLNRLADYLFALAIAVNSLMGINERVWIP